MRLEPTDEMVHLAVKTFLDAPTGNIGQIDAAMRKALAETFAIVERDNDVIRKPTPEEIAAFPKPKRRLRACVERWPGALIEGDYDPRCCRFPKSCSADGYDEEHVTDADLEPSYEHPGETA